MLPVRSTLSPVRSTFCISMSTFLSKLLERCAYDQLRVYRQVNYLLPEHQSAYRRFHSTETAMLKVLADAYVAADTGHVT